MSEEMKALARRAVACPGWRWMPGVRVWRGDHESPLRMCGPRVGNQPVARTDGPAEPGAIQEYVYIPDLADPATLGCMLALVRDAWAGQPLNGFERVYGLPMVSRRWDACQPVEWRVIDDGGVGLMGKGATEAEALVAALEAAPVRVVPA